MAAPGAAVAADGASKRYGSELAVDDVSFAVAPGTIFGFIGPSGSGKTTIVRLLTGVQRPTSGAVTVLGGDPASFTPAERRRVGYLPQRPVLYPQLSVAANVRFAAALYGVRRHRRAVEKVLDFVELLPHRGKRLASTSGGMQRRAALAAALVHDPAVLFLDEPTAGLDPILRHKLWEHFRRLRDEGRTLLVTTQHVDEAAHCDEVGIMALGRLVTADAPDRLRRRAMGGEVIRVRTAPPLSRRTQRRLLALPHVIDVRMAVGDAAVADIVVDDGTAVMPRLLEELTAAPATVEAIETLAAPFDEVFVRLLRTAPPPVEAP